jgi:excinuclease ABC subunit C
VTSTLLPPATDLRALRQRVRALAENRPGIYRMIDAAGRVLYVGKAKRVRTRVLSYFHATYPDDKAARILAAASGVTWDYVASEFAAHLAELREIRRFRPPFNRHMNRRRDAVFITVGPGTGGAATRGGGTSGHAAKIGVTATVGRRDARYFGPFTSPGRAAAAVRVLNDLLGLRDCADRLPIVFAGQGDLFDAPRRAACLRYDFGTCTGPCAGLVAEAEYQRRVQAALSFLDGLAIHPIDRVVLEMTRASESRDFEAAARWREKFEHLEWLLAAGARARAAIELLTFVYRDPGTFGDDRIYLIRHGAVRASYPNPTTPIEDQAFRAVVRDELARPAPWAGRLDATTIEETLVLLSWFRRHAEALRRTEPLEAWARDA